jgi:hypothetical protein
MIIFGATGSNITPSAFLLLEIETSSVWQEDEGENRTDQTKPRHNVELHLGADVIVHDGGGERTQLSDGG